jgi:predicted neuraminidase
VKRPTKLRAALAVFVVFLLLIVAYKGGERASDRRRIRRAAVEQKKFTIAPPDLIHDPAGGYDEDYVAPPGMRRTAHGSTITELPDHTLLCAWYAGVNESGPDVKIYTSRFDPKAKTWSAPAIAAEYGERAQWSFFHTRSVGNPSLYVDDDGIVWMFYAAIQTGGWDGARTDYKISRDHGFTWSRPKTLVHSWSNLPRNKAIRLGRNEFALPLYHTVGGKYGYTCSVTVADGEITQRRFAVISGERHSQPAIVRFSPDELFAYMRDPAHQDVLFSRLNLARQQWSAVEHLQLPNPNSALDVVRTPDGKILLVYNDNRVVRLPLSLAISDDGEHFTKVHDLENAQRGRWFSYPAMIRAADGTYHVTYSDANHHTIKHVQFSQGWLDEKVRAATTR